MTADESRTAPYADLGMYPFESVRWAWDELWSALHRRTPWSPGALAWAADAEACWRDPACVVTQMCGWPIASRHRGDVHVIGTFQLDIPGAEPGGRYRSVILSRHDRPVADLVAATSTAVVNSVDSLSGWLSLRSVTVGRRGAWPGSLIETGSHVASVSALAEGRGDLTSVDAWSLALIEAEQPELLDGLHRVGVGPIVPVPALVVRRPIAPERADGLASALTQTLTDPMLTEALAALRIAGPAAVSLADFEPIVRLVET